MGLSRYLAKLGALIGSDGRVGNAGISDLDASKLNAGILPIGRLDVSTLVTKAPVCYDRNQIATSQADTVIPIDPQYKQSIIYFRAIGGKTTDTANSYHGYLSLFTGNTYNGSQAVDAAIEWNQWFMSRGVSGSSPSMYAGTTNSNRWAKWLDTSDYGQLVSGQIIVSQPWGSSPRGSLIFDANYTKNNVGAVRATGSGHKTGDTSPINAVQFDWDPSGTGTNPNISIDYYVMGVK